MRVYINGKIEELPGHSSKFIYLLQRQNINEQTPGVAVALNQRVIPRNEWANIEVRELDEIEIVHAVQGG